MTYFFQSCPLHADSIPLHTDSTSTAHQQFYFVSELYCCTCYCNVFCVNMIVLVLLENYQGNVLNVILLSSLGANLFECFYWLVVVFYLFISDRHICRNSSSRSRSRRGFRQTCSMTAPSFWNICSISCMSKSCQSSRHPSLRQDQPPHPCLPSQTRSWKRRGRRRRYFDSNLRETFKDTF